MHNIKLIAGILLIAISAGGFIFWESSGRNLIFEEKIVVACSEIKEGDEFTSENIKIKGIGKEYLMNGALAADNYEKLIGMKAGQYIPEDSQISPDFIKKSNLEEINEKQSIFCLNENMIDMVSSSLRRGDMVHLYGNHGKADLGVYKTAFVKDSSDREVKNAEKLKKDNMLSRENSNYSISKVEIICTKDEYAMINDYIKLSDCGLTIVQQEGSVE